MELRGFCSGRGVEVRFLEALHVGGLAGAARTTNVRTNFAGAIPEDG